MDVVTEFVDVAQGDATVVIDRMSGKALVIDCPSSMEPRVFSVLDRYGSPAVDALMVTHSHLDHYGGVAGIATSLVQRGKAPRQVAFNFEVLLAHGKEPVPTDASGRKQRPLPRVQTHLLELLDLPREVELVDLRAGWEWSVAGNVVVAVLAPTYREIIEAAARQSPNRGSGVVRVSAGGRTTLVGGDAVAASWMRMFADGVDMAADYFRYPHHGALQGRGVDPSYLLDKVGAEVVVVSVGRDSSARNTYNHPSDELLQGIRSHESTLMCTEITPKCWPAVIGSSVCNGPIRIGVGGASAETTPIPSEHVEHVASMWPIPQCVAGE